MTAAIKSKLVPLFKQQDKDLSKLNAPPADKKAIKQFLADMKAVTAQIDKDTAAFVKAHGGTTVTAHGGEGCAGRRLHRVRQDRRRLSPEPERSREKRTRYSSGPWQDRSS